MPYQDFKAKLIKLARQNGDHVKFHMDHEEGLYIASFSNGLRVLGNSVSKSVTCRWGSGHQATLVL